MLIAARLERSLMARLNAATAGCHAILDIPTWRVLRGEVRRRPIDVVIADPAARCADTGDGLASLQSIRDFASVLVYTTVSSETSRAILALGDSGVHDFVFAGFDDAPDRMRLRVEDFAARGADEPVLAQILDAVAQVSAPPGVGDAVRELFRSTWRFRTAQDLAAAAGLSRQHTNVWLHRAGLAPCCTIVTAVRVLRGYQYARMGGLTVVDVAARLRYPDPEVFTNNVRAITGAPLSEWRRQGLDRFVARVRIRLGLPAPPQLALVHPTAREQLRDAG
jgi:AraC-like DNA-binding protein